MRLCQEAIERGVFAQAIRPPTVAAGSSRLRLTAMASHTASELQMAAGVFGDVAREVGLEPESMAAPLPERQAAIDERERADAELAVFAHERSYGDAESATAPFDLERDEDGPRAPVPAQAPVPALAGPRAPFDLERELAERSRGLVPATGRRHARPVRDGDRHGRRQDDPERGAAGGDGRCGRARARLQAGHHRPRRRARRSPSAVGGHPITSCSPRPRAWTPEEVAPLRFGPAVSPHLAAQLAHERIAPEQLERGARARRAPEGADRAATERDAARGTLIVEGVGGLLVPLRGRLHRVRPRRGACGCPC